MPLSLPPPNRHHQNVNSFPLNCTKTLLVAVPKSGMCRPMELEAIRTAVLALAQAKCEDREREAAKRIKLHFDRRYGPNWHCVVGGQFGCLVSHLRAEFIHFYVGPVAILLYRSMGDNHLQ